MADWQKFYQATDGKPPQPLLVKAAAFCNNKAKALDLGAGTLRDGKFLLEQGFDVVAVDGSALMIEAAKKIKNEHLHTIQANFDQYEFPRNEFDLVNAQWALPFNGPTTFNAMFAKLAASLKSGGIFTGQFFGRHDEWNTPDGHMTFHDKAEVENLLNDFEIIELQEEEKDGTTAVGDTKHWHVFHVIAKKL